MKVQFLNWESRDRKIDGENGKPDYKYTIFGFGRKEQTDQTNDYSLCLIVNNFYPYFYFLAESENTLKNILSDMDKKFNLLCLQFKKKDKNYISQKCRDLGLSFFNESYIREFLKDQSLEVESNIFMGKGFENFKKRRFVKVFFKTQRAFRFYQSFIPYCDPNYVIYEGNINPMLKMFHDQNFQPSSWLEIEEKRLVIRSELSKWTKADEEYVAYYTFFEKGFIKVINENNSLWFKLCSFDLECESSHGDYPVAQKDYSKFIRELRKLLKPMRKKDLENSSELLNEIIESINNCMTRETKHFSRIFGKSENYAPIRTEFLTAQLIKMVSEDNCNGKVFDEFHEFLKEYWGEVEGDKIIQIGNIIEYPKGFYKKVIFCLNETEIENDSETIVFSCKSESELIIKWADWFQKEDPDILMGYNIFNFDNEYLWTRAIECNVLPHVVQKMSRLENENTQIKDMTKGTGKFLSMNGREMIDLMDYVKKNYSLDSYSLDNVSARFIRGKIINIEKSNDNSSILILNSRPVGLKANDYLKIYINNGIYEEKFTHKDRSKFKIRAVSDKSIHLNDTIELDQEFINEWCLSKDDILPNQIFEFQKGTKFQRGLIAKYCIQDCMLCHYIFQKLEVLVNNMAMSNVCFVPFGYLFLRGQSVKIFSLIAKQCADENYRIPVRNVEYGDSEENLDSYEGALVLNPEVGIYIDEPIAVNDFNSLYPSCGIAENISPDTHVIDPAYLNLEGYTYNEVEFDELESQVVFAKNGKAKKNKEAVRVGTKKCTFVVFPNEQKGILPKIWSKLLAERKDTRKKMEKETDAFRKTLLDGLQLAFKTTANSMYGIFGFRKSPLYYQDVAASITACGRRNLNFAKNYIETNYPGSKIVYGDTDSLFVSFPSKKSSGSSNSTTELEKIYESIDIATEAGDNISKQLKPPHNLGFEKCISPFILMSRKRYTGLYYTSKSPKKYMNTMGFVLKRRDNALIVKEIVGNAIKMILYQKDIHGSIKYIREAIMNMLNGNYPIDKFIITKTLRSTYANPEQIAHYVLSLKMGERDPGNKPKVGDRIPYVFVQTKTQNVKQSERIENSKYVLENPTLCKIDYMYYLTNQLMNPLLQVYKLIYFEKTEHIIFSDVLSFAYQKRENISSIKSFFTVINLENSELRKRRFEEETQTLTETEAEAESAAEKGLATSSEPKKMKNPSNLGKASSSSGSLKITNFFAKFE
jgi:DNA polymerase elongation subunit (family B)